MVKAFLSDKGTNINKITLVDNEKVMSGDKQLCKTFMNFPQEVVKTLGVSDNFHMSNYSHSDLVNNATGKHENHPTVEKISKTITAKSTCRFSGVDKANVEKPIGNLNSSKVGNF